MTIPAPRLALAAALALALAPPAAAGDWLQWRGPKGTGEAEGPAPLRWSATEGVRWVRPIPGRGCSTPIVVGERLYLTTAVDLGTKEGAPDQPEPPEGASEGFLRGRLEGRFGEQLFAALAIDRATGEIAWSRKLNKAWPHEGHHAQYGSYASRSIVSDGERLYVSFGSWGVYCLDLAGELVWSVDPGVKLQIRHGHGEGSSPTLCGDLLVHAFDHEGDSFLVAWDKRTGEERWRTARDEPTSWAQPIVVTHDGEQQIVVNGENAVRGYDPATGEELWSRPGLGRAVIVSPVQAGDVVISMTGYLNPNIMAVRLGGEGELDDEQVVWSAQRGAAYTPTPLVLDGDLYVLTDGGQMSCFDAATGEVHYLTKRVGRGIDFKASPVAADGRIYLATEEGSVLVLAANPDKVEVLATNELEDESFIASPVIEGGRIYLRSMKNLYCIEGAGADEREE
jgi:outer membrane protein assembly factor BamB